MVALTLNEATGTYTSREPITSDDILLAARGILDARLRTPQREVFQDPASVRDFLLLHLAHRQREVFACLFLDNRHRLISYEELFFGTIDGASVHPREVVRVALRHNAAAVILAHNHPSGVPEPSAADQRITDRLKEALALIDVRVLDHFIVGGTDSVSFAERGLV